MKLNKRLKFGYVQENAYLCGVERKGLSKGKTLKYSRLQNYILIVIIY